MTQEQRTSSALNPARRPTGPSFEPTRHGTVTMARILGITPRTHAACAAAARHLYERGDFYGARRILSAVCNLNPRDAHSYWSLGIVHRAIGDDAAATAAFRRALEEDPSLVGARLGLAELAWARGDRDAARHELAAAAGLGIGDEALRKHAKGLLAAMTP